MIAIFLCVQVRNFRRKDCATLRTQRMRVLELPLRALPGEEIKKLIFTFSLHFISKQCSER